MDEEYCEVCTNELDATDSSISFCDCNYSLCLWCFHRICEDAKKENTPGRCPNCRAEFDEERIRKQRLDPAKLEEVKKKQKKEEKKKGAPTMKTRKDLMNVRVVQRNLVYVVGLALELCYEDLLKGPEYFGQFGKVVKISVSRAGPFSTAAAKNGPTGSAYITYKRHADAKRCIETVHCAVWEGKTMKACYGTTKYCNAFLKGLVCNNAECLYLHDVADDEDSYTKEETKTPKFVNLVHAASIQKQASQALQVPQAAAAGTPRAQPANGHAAPAAAAALPPTEIERSGLVTSSLPEPLNDQQSGTSGAAWPALGGATWAAKAVTPPAAPLLPPPPPPPQVEDSTQEWPELPGAITDSPEAAKGGNVAPVAPVAAQLQRKGSTMAAELARAASAPNGSAAPSKAPAPRQPAANAVLVVPKKKAAAVRTPKKPAAAPAAAEAQESKAADAPQQSSTAGASADVSEAPPGSKTRKKQGEAEAAPAGSSQQAAAHDEKEKKSSHQEDTMKADQSQSPSADSGGKKAGPPPGFEALNGAAAATNGRPKKGPPPGFVAAEGTGFASSGSPFQSFGSESSTTSAAREQSFSTNGLSGASPLKPPANAWDPAANLPSLDSIWGVVPAHQQAPFLQPSVRSRSRFQFAQGSSSEESPANSSQPAGGGALDSFLANGPAPGQVSSFNTWMQPEANGPRAGDPAGMALLRQLQNGPNGSVHLNGHGNGIVGGAAHLGSGDSDFSLQPGYSACESMPTPVPCKPFQPPPPPPSAGGPPGFAEHRQQQMQASGFHAGPNDRVVPPSQLGPDVQSLESRWLDANQRFRNMAV